MSVRCCSNCTNSMIPMAHRNTRDLTCDTHVHTHRLQCCHRASDAVHRRHRARACVAHLGVELWCAIASISTATGVRTHAHTVIIITVIYAHTTYPGACVIKRYRVCWPAVPLPYTSQCCEQSEKLDHMPSTHGTSPPHTGSLIEISITRRAHKHIHAHSPAVRIVKQR
jgi:hypothetical protein